MVHKTNSVAKERLNLEIDYKKDQVVTQKDFEVLQVLEKINFIKKN